MNFTWRSPSIHLVFTWHFSDHQTITWPSPDPYLALITSFKLKKSLVVGGGGGGWINPLQTLPQGLVFTFDFDFDFDPDPDPELDNIRTNVVTWLPSVF